jgi:hypothetical protein
LNGSARRAFSVLPLTPHLDLAAGRSIAMHFGTFQLTPEGIDEPVRDLENALRERGVPAEWFQSMDVGESLRLGGRGGKAVDTAAVGR